MVTASGSGRWVAHLDMDAFFSSVEQLTRPTLRESPVLVGGAGPRGTVAGASYEARAYGARSAMSMAHARRLCPVATVIPPRFTVYQAVSARVFDLVRRFSPVAEQVSLDEAFIEPGSLAGAQADEVRRVLAELRARIHSEVGMVASIGAGSGKSVAKIASDLAKPDGLLVVTPEEQRAVLRDLPVRALWGIGPVSEGKLRRIGVQTLGEFADLDPATVTALLGTAVGRELHDLAHGRDPRPVAERAEVKQVSAETTFDTDLVDGGALESAAVSMTSAAHQRLVRSHRAARTVTVKVRSADFATVSRSETVRAATSDLSSLSAMARRLVSSAVPPGTPVRLVGVSLAGLTTAEQESLFPAPPTAGPEPHPDEETGPDEATDAGPTPRPDTAPLPGGRDRGGRGWAAGDDVRHPEHGHGWVQGAGVGRVTVRFETRTTGPGPARTFAMDDPALRVADPLASLDWLPVVGRRNDLARARTVEDGRTPHPGPAAGSTTVMEWVAPVGQEHDAVSS
ncbi:DNA polymerase IV [Actinoalloteichus sp. AHMU CJ021]|uniref:DNA polymerase IV n=2 Tax=Actinoalloteichus TaxID=65496 RepID=UPI000418A0B3|nr:DNA polymerase IV [Actinoalloteichus caeruleus]AUS79883.1 DNA polymerase IV [Actinoalloteichus sp. AHMU CJ021]